jgi:hypothetical protein
MALLVLESSGLLDLGGGSRLALVLLPWLALAGLPRSARDCERPAPAALFWRSLLPLLHALPVLAAAAALDHAARQGGLQGTLLLGIPLLLLLSFAAESARHGALRRGLYGALWLVLVPGGALLGAALTWGASQGALDPPSFVTAMAPASPLAWALGRVPPGGPTSAAPLLSALVLLVLGLAPLPARAGLRGRGAAVLALFLFTAAPAAAGHTPASVDGARVAFARVELAGPLAGFTLDAGRAGSTHFEGPRGALVAGERRTVLLPVPVQATGAPLEPEIRLHPVSRGSGGTARFLGWMQPSESPDVRALLAGPLPELGRRDRGASPALLLWLAFFFAAGLLVRGRVRLELAVAFCGALVCGALVVLRPEGHEAELRLVTGKAGGAWLELEAAGDVLETGLDPESTVLLGSPSARVELHVGLDFDARGRVRIVCPGETVTVARALERGARRLERGINAWGDFEASWTRAGDGTWAGHGPWRLGTPLPEEQANPADPPGWLQAALPLGRSVFLGRVAPVRGQARWLRLLDF